jgi:cytochrome c
MMKPVVAVALLALTAGVARADVGQDLFDTQCASCHSLDGHSTASGPSLKGVVWRKIASLSDFNYSASLKAQVGSWSPQRLDAYLRDAQHFAPGTDMFWDINDAAERKAIVRFLERQGG